MNKLALSLALVAMFVGLAAADLIGKKHRHHLHDHEDFEPEFEHHRPIHRHHQRHQHHEHHEHECLGCGNHHHHQHEGGHHHEGGDHEGGHHQHHEGGHHEGGHHEGGHHEGGHHEGGHHEHDNEHGHNQHHHGLHHKAGHLNKKLRHHHNKGRTTGGAGFAAGSKSRKELDAGIHSNSRLSSHNSAEGQKSFLAGKRKGFRAGLNHNSAHDREGHNRHSGFNKDKLIVKERENGFNDDTGFRNHDSDSDSAHLAGSEAKFVGGKKSGKIVSNKDSEHDLSAGIHGESDQESGIVGGIGGSSEF